MTTYNLNNEPVKVYDVKLDIIEEPKQQLQRTEEWFNARKGRFTGSKIKDLMTCGRSSAKLEWGRPEKLIDFGDTAKKYIFSKAKEIQRNKVVHMASTQAMQYGTNNESVVIELLKEMYPNWTFSEQDFIEFIPNIAGASPDGIFIRENDIVGVEIKCVTDWAGLYNRHIEPIDQSNEDFWQLQSEMLALNVSEIMYVVAEPSENIFEPNITDLSIEFVPCSPVHQKAIIDRCTIGRKAIDYYLKGVNFHQAIQLAASEYDG